MIRGRFDSTSHTADDTGTNSAFLGRVAARILTTPLSFERSTVAVELALNLFIKTQQPIINQNDYRFETSNVRLGNILNAGFFTRR